MQRKVPEFLNRKQSGNELDKYSGQVSVYRAMTYYVEACIQYSRYLKQDKLTRKLVLILVQVQKGFREMASEF